MFTGTRHRVTDTVVLIYYISIWFAGASLVVWSGYAYFDAELGYNGLAGSESDRAINRLAWVLLVFNVIGGIVCAIGAILTMVKYSTRRTLAFAICQTFLVLTSAIMINCLLTDLARHTTHQ